MRNFAQAVPREPSSVAALATGRQE